MDLEKSTFGTKHVPVVIDGAPGDRQWLFRFENGYGASIITGYIAYGGAELAVIRWMSDSDGDFELDYSTPITSNVIGSLTPEYAEELLDQIKALPPRRGVEA